MENQGYTEIINFLEHCLYNLDCSLEPKDPLNENTNLLIFTGLKPSDPFEKVYPYIKDSENLDFTWKFDNEQLIIETHTPTNIINKVTRHDR